MTAAGRRTPVASLHVPGRVLVVPCVWDAASARAVTASGAELIATTSAGVSWSFGRPDGQSLDAAELLRRVREIVEATDQPVSVDIEEGYSTSPPTVADLVRELIQIGVGGVNIEDGKEPPVLLKSKIEAIVDCVEAERVDFFINARCDVYLRGLSPASARVEEVVGRAKRYQEAGCSGIFVPGVTSSGEIAAMAQELLPQPLNVMMIPGLPPAEELARLGVQRLSAGPFLAQIAYKAVATSARHVLRHGHDDSFFADADLQGIDRPSWMA